MDIYQSMPHPPFRHHRHSGINAQDDVILGDAAK
jgi:hypothetical protein